MTDETTRQAADPSTDPGDANAAAPSEITPEDAGSVPRRRGSLAIYGAAFGLLLLAAVSLVVGAFGILAIVNVAETSLFGTQRILRVSAVLSGLAIVTAIVAVLVPRRSA